VKVHVERSIVSVAAVAFVTDVIFGLKTVAPVLSLGVLYLFAVLPVAVFYGLAYALAVSILSMVAFSFFFLPPLHTLAPDGLRELGSARGVPGHRGSRQRAGRKLAKARAAVEAETLRRSDAVKTAVLHAVSHDLRSPLTAIRAAGEGLQSPSLELNESDRAEEDEAKIERDWRRFSVGLPLEMVDAPFRDLGKPLLAHLRQITADPDAVAVVVMPELVVGGTDRLLHNQRALYLKRLLLFEPRVILTSVPFQLV
jgi:signal transduction histidine kinase